MLRFVVKLDEQRILAAKRKAEETMSKTNEADLTAKLSREIAKLRVYELTKTKLANRR